MSSRDFLRAFSREQADVATSAARSLSSRDVAPQKEKSIEAGGDGARDKSIRPERMIAESLMKLGWRRCEWRGLVNAGFAEAVASATARGAPGRGEKNARARSDANGEEGSKIHHGATESIEKACEPPRVLSVVFFRRGQRRPSEARQTNERERQEAMKLDLFGRSRSLVRLVRETSEVGVRVRCSLSRSRWEATLDQCARFLYRPRP